MKTREKIFAVGFSGLLIILGLFWAIVAITMAVSAIIMEKVPLNVHSIGLSTVSISFSLLMLSWGFGTLHMSEGLLPNPKLEKFWIGVAFCGAALLVACLINLPQI